MNTRMLSVTTPRYSKLTTSTFAPSLPYWLSSLSLSGRRRRVRVPCALLLPPHPPQRHRAQPQWGRELRIPKEAKRTLSHFGCGHHANPAWTSGWCGSLAHAQHRYFLLVSFLCFMFYVLCFLFFVFCLFFFFAWRSSHIFTSTSRHQTTEYFIGPNQEVNRK